MIVYGINLIYTAIRCEMTLLFRFMWVELKMITTSLLMAAVTWRINMLDQRLIADVEPGTTLVGEDGAKIGRVVEIMRDGQPVKRLVQEDCDEEGNEGAAHEREKPGYAHLLWTGCRLVTMRAWMAVAQWRQDRIERRMVARLAPGPIFVNDERVGRVVEIIQNGRPVKKIVREKRGIVLGGIRAGDAERNVR